MEETGNICAGEEKLGELERPCSGVQRAVPWKRGEKAAGVKQLIETVNGTMYVCQI